MTDRLEALERLARLKADSLLTDEEFARQKTALLSTEYMPTEDAAPTLTFGQRYREARKRQRGIWRYVRWFFCAQLAFVVLLAIYFLTRAGNSERQGAPANVSTAQLDIERASGIGPAPAQRATDTNDPGNTDDVDVTDAVLADPWTYDSGGGGEASSQDVCASGLANVKNQTRQTFHLRIDPVAEGSTLADLGELKPGSSASVRMGGVGQFILGRTIGDGAIPLMMLNVVNCHTDDN